MMRSRSIREGDEIRFPDSEERFAVQDAIEYSDRIEVFLVDLDEKYQPKTLIIYKGEPR